MSFFLRGILSFCLFKSFYRCEFSNLCVLNVSPNTLSEAHFGLRGSVDQLEWLYVTSLFALVCLAEMDIVSTIDFIGVS